MRGSQRTAKEKTSSQTVAGITLPTPLHFNLLHGSRWKGSTLSLLFLLHRISFDSLSRSASIKRGIGNRVRRKKGSRAIGDPEKPIASVRFLVEPIFCFEKPSARALSSFPLAGPIRPQEKKTRERDA